MAGRLAAGILVTCCLLSSGVPVAQAEQAAAEPGSLAALEERLERRIAELEQAKAAYEQATRELEALKQRVEQLERARPEPAAVADQHERLEQRLEELEIASVAQEDATRSIIRQALSGLGSNINEYVVFGGTLEVLGGWERPFRGGSEGLLRLDTAELDFEIEVNPWTRGSMVFQYVDGTDILFPSLEEDEVGVDRINVDTAFLTLGDTQRFPPFAKVGRQIVPFGISTGDPVADVLTIESPLTVEVFEDKEDAVLLGIEFPTPPLMPIAPIPTPEPVRPQVLAPLIQKLSRLLGFRPFPTPPPAPSFTIPPPPAPPFNAGVYFFDGDTFERTPRRGWAPGKHFGATAGYRTKGSCRPYLGRERGVNSDELPLHWLNLFCPWGVEIDVDYTNSVFDTSFLGFEYRGFLKPATVDDPAGGIGFEPGMSGSLKTNLGPFSLVGEWNGALNDATFRDDLNRRIRMTPAAWQFSLGYQLGWKPWVESIGAQGTYLTVGYSESRDLEGVMRLIGGDPERVGFVAEKRFLVGAGEWISDGLRFSVEYAYNKDYPKKKGGTGRSSSGILSLITYEW